MQVHRKPIREQKLPKRLEDFVTLIEFANIMNSLEDLVTFTEALAKDDIQKWKAIMEEDMSFLRKNNTWILSKLPANCKGIGCMWVFWTKRNDHGQIVHHNVRLVIKGYA